MSARPPIATELLRRRDPPLRANWRHSTRRLMWFNFAHLFSMSLLPLSTAGMAVSRLAPQPVAFYAAS